MTDKFKITRLQFEYEIARYETELLRYMIVLTVKKLSKKIRNWVWKNCSFLFLGPYHGLALNLKLPLFRRKYLILLDRRVNQKAIAHEIAHCWLKHPSKDQEIMVKKADSDKEENEAWDIVEKWGFKVTATDRLPRVPVKKNSEKKFCGLGTKMYSIYS